MSQFGSNNSGGGGGGGSSSSSASPSKKYLDLSSSSQTGSEDQQIGFSSSAGPQVAVSSYDQANIFQVYCLSFMLPLFRKSREKQLTLQDIGPPPRDDHSRVLGSRLEQVYNKQILRGQKPSLIKALFKVFGPQLLMISLLDFMSKCFFYPMLTISLGWLIRDAGIYLTFSAPALAGGAPGAATTAAATAVGQANQTVAPVVQPVNNVQVAATMDADQAYWQIVYDSIQLLACQMLAIILAHPFFFFTYHMGMKCRIAVCYLIYRKSLRLSQSAMSETTVGQMVNLLSNDVNRFDQVCQMIPYLIMAPLQAMIVLVVLSLFYLGLYPTLSTLIAIVCYVLLQTVMGRGFSRYRSKTARRTDERVRLMNEIILAMKIIKMYAWEKPFKLLVHSARQREITTIGIASILRTINQTLFFTSGKIIVFIGLIVYVSIGYPLNPEILFVTIGLANLVRISLTLFFPNAVAYMAETYISCKRINTFLNLAEIEQTPAFYRISADTLGCKHALTMSKVYASWPSKRSKPTKSSEATKSGEPILEQHDQNDPMNDWAILRNLTLSIKPRDLVLIVGRVGSGKSSVLMSILGELPLSSGRLEVNGRISYASQEAWIFSGTVRENILFGKPLDQDRYQRVLRACSLQRDLEILVEGDQTIVGERGVSLSGGQKARVNLARAIYQDADIYLLDDPLSAVDAPVAKSIFNETLRLFLRKKTVLLATHQLQFLKHATKVLVVDRNSPAAFGGLQEVMESEAFAVVGYGREAFKDATTSATSAGEQTDGPEAAATASGGGKQEDSRESTKSRSPANDQQESPSRSSSDKSQSANLTPPEGETDSMNSDERRLIRARSQASSNLAESVRQLSCDDVSPEQRLMAKKKQQDEGAKGSSRRHGAELLSDISSNFQTYLYYLSNACSLVLFIWFILVNVLTQALFIYTDYFLSFWTDSVQRQEYQGANFVPVTFVDQLTTGQISGIYAALVGLLLVISLVRTATFFAGTLRASINIHRRFFECIIHAPMTFFDFSPIGILLNRLSRDIGFVDETLPATAIEIVTIFVNIAGIIILAIMLDVINLVATCVLVLLIIYARTRCSSTITRLKQIEGVTKSPVFSHLSTTLAGLPTIRAFRVQPEFVRLFNKHQDAHSSAWFNYIASGRWLAVALDWCCMLFIASVITFLLVYSLDATNASLVGLLISQVVVLPGPLQWGVRQLIEVESQMTSVQRIKEFSELETEEGQPGQTPGQELGATASGSPSTSSPTSEPSSSNNNNNNNNTDDDANQPILASYHSGRIPAPAALDQAAREGEIKFVDVSLSYFPDEPPVLRNLNLTIRPREKLGIVGRTGAGKSSIVSVLFRLYNFDGRIELDGRDTKRLTLAQLRQSMSIIPQDPILFGGTIRKNLDPFANYSDAELWDALEAVHLRQLFARHAQGLDYAISEGGANFSVGQRQLICLARAIVRRNKILILDEATANVDPETDMFIQRTIARQFQNCTVLTIAHRLITIVDSDRLLVLDRGQIGEFDEPQALLKRDGGLFKQMVDSSGQQAARLVRLIEEAHQRRQRPPLASGSDSN